MPETVPQTVTDVGNEDPTKSRIQLDGSDTGYSPKSTRKPNIIIDTVASRTNIDSNSISKGKGATVARDLGFALCDPDYDRDGELPRSEHLRTDVDIIGVAAIGADSIGTWGAKPRHTVGSSFPVDSVDDSNVPLWITRDIRKSIPKVRVLLYDGHSEPGAKDRLKDLALRLLERIHALRHHDKNSRPFFLICHSTGGLVAKYALILAAQGTEEDKLVTTDCFGISFFATPHQGSSRLSQPEFSTSIVRAMRLRKPLPESLQNEMQINGVLLQMMASSFRSLAADLKVWTFYETRDSDLTIPSTAGDKEIPFYAPITSIRSAILDLHHEVDYPMLTDHMGCASFAGPNTQTMHDYLQELTVAVEQGHKLSKIKHHELNLEEKVEVEIIGFYKGLSRFPNSEAPISLWSTRKALHEFTALGPSKCLEERLQEVSAPPAPHQFLRSTTRTFSPKQVRDPSIRVSDSENQPLLKLRRPSLQEGRKHLKRFRWSSANIHEAHTEAPEGTILKEPLPNGTASIPASFHTAGVMQPKEDGSTDPAQSKIDGKLSSTVWGQNNKPSSRSLLAQDSETQEPTSHPSPVLHEQIGSIGDFDALPALRLVKPDATSCQLTWVHVPFNNPTWVSEILSSISADRGNNYHGTLLDSRNWSSKHVWSRQSEHHACFVKHGCSLISHGLVCSVESSSPAVSPGMQGAKSPADLRMSLYLPYLHWDTYKLLVKRRDLVKRRMLHGRSRPAPEDVFRMDLEHRVIWASLGNDPPFNCRRTLDQFAYPNLHDTRARDDDQMLYKMTKERHKVSGMGFSNIKSHKKRDEHNLNDKQRLSDDQGNMKTEEINAENNILDGTVLMVDQLWLWVISEDITATFFPRRESKPIDGRLYQQADLRDSIFNEVNGDLGRRCENSLDLAALVVLHAVTVLFDSPSYTNLDVFRIFEESISILTENLIKSFKDFRSLGFRDKSAEYDTDNVVINIREKHRLEGRLSEKQNRDDISAMLELRDINDELQSLQKLFNQQRETIGQMFEIYQRPICAKFSGNGTSILRQALDKLDEYSDQVQQMMRSAGGTRTDFEKLLDLKQKQANVDEARLARFQADLASVQSRAVTTFTVFTVIFLPLTFFTGLFGMNISEWSSTPTNVSWRTVVLWSIPFSFAITLSALLLALNPRVRKYAVDVIKAVLWLMRSFALYCRNLLLRHGSASQEAADAAQSYLRSSDSPPNEKRGVNGRRVFSNGKNDITSVDTVDFWRENAVPREKEYSIPYQNRRVTVDPP